LKEGYAIVDFAWLPSPLAFSLQWFKEIRAQQTLTDMQRFDRPILAIAGLADSTVPHGQSVQLIKQSHHAMSQLVLLAGASHIFNVLTPRPGVAGPSSHERLLNLTQEWITQLAHAEANMVEP